ncbi:MAG TPA: acyltransferase, partial [Alphaproteobacteria bacterium]|nr:acyltransferase [Alphaproteobacteria bacterium]
MKYRSEIDGLRAFAVIPVIFFHAGFLGLGGGFLGVDVFFTISGFLITSIILDDLDKGQFSLSHFYVRRIKRILPSLFVVLTCSTIAALLLFTPVFLKSYSESLMAVSTFSSNIFFWLTGGYFDIASELKPLLHTWSLAVEEQYYIFFPLGLMLLWRTGKEKLFILVLLGTVFSLGLSHWCAYHKPGANFFLLPMRMWQILLGSSIAFYTNMHGGIKTSPLQAQCLSFLGILLILSSYMFLDEKTPLPSLYALMPTLGTGLIIMFADTRTLANKILSNRFVVGIGLISYSAYLWHQPLFVFARYKLEAPSLMLMSGLGVLSLILASITWYYVEKPCRRKNNASKKMIFLLAFVGLSVFFLIGLAGHFSRGFESFYYNVRLTSQQKEMYLFVKKNTDYRL